MKKINRIWAIFLSCKRPDWGALKCTVQTRTVDDVGDGLIKDRIATIRILIAMRTKESLRPPPRGNNGGTIRP
jgi:hypothetical protein